VKRLFGRVVALLPRDDWLVVGYVLASRVLLFVFGAKSFQVLENKRVTGVFGWIEIWNRWDADQYLRLAKLGYSGSSVWKAWLYPFFPWCVRFVAWTNGNYLMSAIVVSITALLIASILLRRLVQMDFGRGTALRSVWFFLIFPTAYFLHAPYTESLFVALTIGSALAARQTRWWLGGLLGALAWMTRANGVVLLPMLVAEAAHQFWTKRRWNWHWLWIALVPAGFAVYLLINWKVAGDPFAFWRSREALFAMSISWPWTGVGGSVGILRHWTPSSAEMVGAQEFYFAMLGLICTIAAWLKLRPLYAVWMTGSWLLFTSVNFLASMPRYALTMFPIFILFALLTKKPFWNAVLTIWSLLFLALFSSLFVRGWWAF
jgi:hypothetical protein